MAAANSKGRVLAGSFGKRFAHQIWAGKARDPAPLPSLSSSRRGVAHGASSYDKNIDDQVRPTVVPDHVIEYKGGDKYWGPNPSTGVFGPADPQAGGGGAGIRPPSAGNGPASALDQTAWFRPLEDVDKPPHA